MRFRVEWLLPLACAAAAAALAASEFMTLFEFRINGEVEKIISASDRHYYSMLILAIFAFVALLVAVLTGSRPAAVAVAVAGGIALLMFLVVDVPDAGQRGSLSKPEFVDSKAEPAFGFWVELAGAAGLALCGLALATLRDEQLEDLAPVAETGKRTPAPGRKAKPAKSSTNERPAKAAKKPRAKAKR